MISNDSSISKPTYIFRWIAVIPGAVLCAVLIEFPIHWFLLLIGHVLKTVDYIKGTSKNCLKMQRIEGSDV